MPTKAPETKKMVVEKRVGGELNSSRGRFLKKRKSSGWLGKTSSIITKPGLASQRVFDKLVNFQ